MSNGSLGKLQEAAKEISSAKTPEQRMASLTKAFELFTNETNQLRTAYTELKERFQVVNNELEQANINLKEKVLQLDFVTNYLENILSNISQGIIFIDLNGTVTTCNLSSEQMMDVESKKVLFIPFWDSFEDDAFGFSMRQALAMHEVPASAFVARTTTQGTQRDLEISATFVLKGSTEDRLNDVTQGLIVLIRDITNIRYLQMVANRNNRLKELGEMASMVAHEIRNPLGGIKGFASLLQRDLESQPNLLKMVNYIIDGTDSLNKLVTNVLNYSRPLQVRLEATGLVALLQDVKNHFQADSTVSDNIKIIFDSQDHELIAPADPMLLKGVMMNLLVNAMQAMPKDGGTIRLEVGKSGTEAIIKISDTGIGITPENLEKIFSPFFTTRAEGNGLGLAEVYKVVEAHGGNIEVESEVNKGTSFTIRLPLKAYKLA